MSETPSRIDRPADLHLSMNPADPPPFYKIDDMAFQELCRDVLELEPQISTCDIYGVSGQAQRGIDLKAVVRNTQTVVVAQCKCCEYFSARQIKAASDEFLKYIDYWKARNVHKFILMVAGPLDTTQQQEEIISQTRRFRELGIEYETWSSRTLRTKLKDQRQIVLRYTKSQDSVDTICGPATHATQTISVSMDRATGLVDAVLSSQLSLFSEKLSSEMGKNVDEVRELYRSGNRTEAYDQLEMFKKDPSWQILDPSVKGRILRQQAAYRLEIFSDVAGATALADEANVLDPNGDEIAIRTFVSYYTDGPMAALTIVGLPGTTSSLNTRLALLLELERPGEVVQQLKECSAISRDAETHRLEALANLVLGDIPAAESAIQVAYETAPKWEFIRFTKAIIGYVSCLVSLPRRLINWPEPPDWAIVKTDDKSLERLRCSEREFAVLAENTQRGEFWQRIVETWRLACLANDPNRQEEASQFCRSLLDKDPTHYRAVIWAHVRNYQFQLTDSESALSRSIETDSQLNPIERVEIVCTLISLFLRAARVTEAKDLLEKTQADFSAVGGEPGWNFWYSQMLLAEGEIDTAIANAKQERNPDFRRKMLLAGLRAQGESSGDWRPYFRYLERCYRRTKGSEYLFELCAIHAELNDWEFVASQSHALVQAVRSPTAVRLAAHALWKKKSVDACLKLLNQCERYFPGKILPGDLTRLRVECRITKGALPQAVTEAKDLLRREGRVENVLALMQAQLRHADLKELAVTARTLIDSSNVEPQALLRAATWVQFEDVELAKRLWRRAAEDTEADPVQLTGLIEAGYALGLDRETAPLFAQARRFSNEGKGSFKFVTVDDYLKSHRERIQHLSDLQKDYDQGAFPLHVMCDAVNRTLVDLLHGVLEHQRKEFTPLRQSSVFIRHGGRPLFEDLVGISTEWRLHLDASALIVAEDLGLLDVVERVFQPIRISPRLLSALVIQQRELQHRQPSQIRLAGDILSFVDDGRIQALGQFEGRSTESADELGALSHLKGAHWVAVLREAHLNGGYVVDHLPLMSPTAPHEQLMIPAPFASRVVGCDTILRSLQEFGWISLEQSEAAHKSLRNSHEPGEPLCTLPEGTRLFFSGNVIESLAEAGLLAIVSKHFEVSADDSYLQYARQMVRTAQYLDELQGWLRRLTERVRNGINSGVYCCVEVPDSRLAEEPERGSFADTATVTDLLIENPERGTVLWIDDRHINSYSRGGRAPIVGVNEVLAALRLRGELSDQDYFNRLHDLRRGNAKYVPVSSEEILWHLDRAPIINEEIQETPELMTLRRYVASCLSDLDCLQVPPRPEGSANPSGEIAFVLETKRAIEESIVKVWQEGAAIIGVSEARAEWILSNMYTGSFGIRHLLPNAEARGDASYLLGLDLAGLITTGILINIGNPLEGVVSPNCASFINWFENRVMLPRLRANPETAKVAGLTIAALIRDAAAEEYKNETEEELSRLVKYRLFSNLPREIRKEVNLSEELMTWIGTRVIETVTLGSVDFERNAFSSAVESLMNGESEVALSDVKGSNEFILERQPDHADGAPIIHVLDTSKVSKSPLWQLKDHFLLMGSHNSDTVHKALLDNRYWFDSDKDSFETILQEVMSLPSATARLDKVQEWRRESAEVYYRDLQARLTRSPNFEWSELIPSSAQGLVRHYRLPSQINEIGDFRSIWSKAGQDLVSDEGLEVALERLACVPIRIPEGIIQQLAAMPADDRDNYFRRLASRWTSPVTRLQLVDLILRTSANTEAIFAAAQETITALYDRENGNAQFKLFESLLSFVHEAFAYRPDTSVWPTAVRLVLVWAHASQLHQIFTSAQVNPGEFAEVIERYIRGQSAAEVLHRRLDLWNDVLHWRRFSRQMFLTHGVAAALSNNDPVAIKKLRLKDLIEDTAFREDERRNVIPLLRDSELTINATGSFLGGDREQVLNSATGEDFSGLSSKVLRTLVTQALTSLRENATARDWGTIDCVVGDLPIYDDLSSQLKELIRNSALEKVCSQDCIAALLALRVAANQSPYWKDDEINAQLEDSIVRLAALESHNTEEGQPISEDARMGALFDGALGLSIKSNDAKLSSLTFSRILRRILESSPKLANHFSSGFVTLLLQLPAAQLHGMWQLLLFLRASRETTL
jgi:hypothetical protein